MQPARSDTGQRGYSRPKGWRVQQISERAGENVGDEAALMALAARETPKRSAAELADADLLPGESGAGG